jgi:hypothetical protein
MESLVESRPAFSLVAVCGRSGLGRPLLLLIAGGSAAFRHPIPRAGTRRVYGSYWNRIVEAWGDRRLDEPTPSDVQRLVVHVRTHIVARRNARGGRSAAEYTIATLRCIYRQAIADGLVGETDNRQTRHPVPPCHIETRGLVLL